MYENSICVSYVIQLSSRCIETRLFSTFKLPWHHENWSHFSSQDRSWPIPENKKYVDGRK